MTTSKAREQDHVDRWLEEVSEELPSNIDLTVEGIVDRIGGIARRLNRVLDETVSAYGLSHGEWRVLTSLRCAWPLRRPPDSGRCRAGRELRTVGQLAISLASTTSPPAR